MWILALGLFVVALIAYILGYISFRNSRGKVKNGEIDHLPQRVDTEAGCCGRHEMCEKDSLLASVSRQIEYYDDEELDAYRGKSPGEFTHEEVEEFRDIFYTMQDTDVAGWVRSLQLRGINLPDEMKDEVFLVIGERRD